MTMEYESWQCECGTSYTVPEGGDIAECYVCIGKEMEAEAKCAEEHLTMVRPVGSHHSTWVWTEVNV